MTHRISLRKILIILFWIAAWQLAGMIIHNDIIFAGPGDVIRSFLILVPTTDFWCSIGWSFGKISLGFCLAFVLGVLLGSLAFRFHLLAEFLSPVILLIKSIPVASFVILALIWRWTGYNMVFYLAGLQNIEYSVYEAAKIDGANGWKTFWKITVPLLKPTIIMTFIMSINGTLQLFDESVNLTKGGPANSTMTMSHYIYNTCFINVPNFGYASAMSFIIFIMVAVLAFINLKVGDTRD